MSRRTFLAASAVTSLPVTGGLPRGAFWSDGAQLVISISMQFEAGAQPETGAGSPFPSLDPRYPDYPVASWYEYGAREGVPRLLELWARHRIHVTSHVVGHAAERWPSLAKEIADRGHEIAAHGQTWTPQYSMSRDDERASLEASVRTLERITGQRPVGFNAFWMRGTPYTLELLQELGFRYHIDDLSRDEPFVREVNGRPFAVVPYTVRNNDIVRFESPSLSASAFADDLRNEFEQLYAEGATRRRMLSISVHDRIGGTPARVRVLDEFVHWAKRHPRVSFWRKDAIAEVALAHT